MTYRRGSRKPRLDPRDPLALSKKLPIRLRTLDSFLGWDDAGKSRYNGYLAELTDWLAEQPGIGVRDEVLAFAVAKRARCGAEDWYRLCLNPLFVK